MDVLKQFTPLVEVWALMKHLQFEDEHYNLEEYAREIKKWFASGRECPLALDYPSKALAKVANRVAKNLRIAQGVSM